MILYFCPFLPGFQIFLNLDGRRVFLPPLEAMKAPPDYRDRAYGVRETHHTPFDQTPLEGKKVRVSQMLRYSLVVLLRAFENRGVIPHTHAVHNRALLICGEALHFVALSQVIF